MWYESDIFLPFSFSLLPITGVEFKKLRQNWKWYHSKNGNFKIFYCMRWTWLMRQWHMLWFSQELWYLQDALSKIMQVSLNSFFYYIIMTPRLLGLVTIIVMIWDQGWFQEWLTQKAMMDSEEAIYPALNAFIRKKLKFSRNSKINLNQRNIFREVIFISLQLFSKKQTT
jgi:hypothetical protein